METGLGTEAIASSPAFMMEKYLYLPTLYEHLTEKRESKFGKMFGKRENRITYDLAKSVAKDSCMQFIENSFLP